jgi:hypothetical protein
MVRRQEVPPGPVAEAGGQLGRPHDVREQHCRHVPPRRPPGSKHFACQYHKYPSGAGPRMSVAYRRAIRLRPPCRRHTFGDTERLGRIASGDCRAGGRAAAEGVCALSRARGTCAQPCRHCSRPSWRARLGPPERASNPPR